MKTKTIFKTLAFAMLMPAMLLTTACSSSDDDSIINNDNTEKNGFELPVTVNVTRQSDKANTRAKYTDNGNGTGSLAFSSGDKLFVYGGHPTAGAFIGTLDWVSDETFSGTLAIENAYSGTAQKLLESADIAYAILLPNNYGEYGFIYIDGEGFNAEVLTNDNNTFANTKAKAVEQFSYEEAQGYDNGFVLQPQCPILYFTINGFSPYSSGINFELKFKDDGEDNVISGYANANNEGVATFAIGLTNYWRNIDTATLSLEADSKTIPLNIPAYYSFQAGKIYNINRSVSN